MDDEGVGVMTRGSGAEPASGGVLETTIAVVSLCAFLVINSLIEIPPALSLSLSFGGEVRRGSFLLLRDTELLGRNLGGGLIFALRPTSGSAFGH